MADDLEAEERRWKPREGNFAGMLGGLLFMVLVIAAILGMFLLAPSIHITTPDPGQEKSEVLE